MEQATSLVRSGAIVAAAGLPLPQVLREAH